MRYGLAAKSVAVLAVASLVLGACGSTKAKPSVASTSLASAVQRVRNLHYDWLISAGALSRLSAAGLPHALLEAYFNKPSTILIGASRPDPLALKASLAVDFTSAKGLISTLSNHRVPADAKYLVLDIEAWPLTPSDEQHQPIQAAQQAQQAAQAAGKTLIFTPGTDLVKVLLGHPVHRRALVSSYDGLIATPGAHVADILEVQSQGTEATPLSATFAESALKAARAARSFEPVLIGLSTNPDGRTVTPADLMALVRSVPDATGFWLNVPQAGRACPHCGQAQPQVGVAFLEQLAGLTPPPSPSPVVQPSGLLGSDGELLAAEGQPADWVLAYAHFQQVVGAPGAAKIMAGGQIFEPLSPRQDPSKLLPVVGTLVVHSEAALSQAISQGSVPPDIKAVLYDNERFPDTPSNEQANPAHYYDLVAEIAAAHRWVSICDFIEPDRLPAGSRNPAAEVPPCSVVGLNTVQQSERDPASYQAVVAKDVSIVHAVDPTKPVLAGLSSNPAGGPLSPSELTADIERTHSLVAGYWLNVPAPGVGCPKCASPDPQLMVAALQALAPQAR